MILFLRMMTLTGRFRFDCDPFRAFQNRENSFKRKEAILLLRTGSSATNRTTDRLQKLQKPSLWMGRER